MSNNIELLIDDLRAVLDNEKYDDYTYNEVIGALEFVKMGSMLDAFNIPRDSKKEDFSINTNKQEEKTPMKKKIIISLLIPFFIFMSCDIMRSKITFPPLPGSINIKAKNNYIDYSCDEFMLIKVVPDWLKQFQISDKQFHLPRGVLIFDVIEGKENVYDILLLYTKVTNGQKVPGALQWHDVDVSKTKLSKSHQVNWKIFKHTSSGQVFYQFNNIELTITF
jgi:hypothetical protein